MNNYEFADVLDALPAFLQKLVFAVAVKKNASTCMALPTVISGMAAGVHGAKSLIMPDGTVEPLAVNSIILAKKSTGKTRTHNLVHAIHINHDGARHERFLSLKKSQPKLKLREVIQSMATARTLMESLDGWGHATSISTFEGKLALDGHVFKRQLGLLCMLWDGIGKVSLPLTNGDRLIAFEPSLNILLMVQPSEFFKYCIRDGDSARGIGFFARCLFTLVPDSMHAVDMPMSEADVNIDEYYKDVDAYLRAQDEMQTAGQVKREHIEFSPGAKLLWDEFKLEMARISYGFMLGAEDAADRAMQQVARLAGVIQSYYPHRTGDSRIGQGTAERSEIPGLVSAATLRAAWAIAQWHLGQFLALFPIQMPIVAPLPPPPSPKLNTQQKRLITIGEDAETVMIHFQTECHQSGEKDALKSAVAARSGLYQQRFTAALFYLTDGNWLVLEGEGKKTRLHAGERQFFFTAASL